MTKGLEAIELLTDSVYYALIECKENISTETKKAYLNAYNTIEKELKALEIIKEKDVDVGWLKRAGNLYHYNMGMSIKSYGALDQEEYDLLKEVLL